MSDQQGGGLEGSLLERMEAAASLSALDQAQALGSIVGEVGFDWDSAQEAFAKVREEVEELAEEMEAVRPERARIVDEMGDLLFAAAMIARKLEIDASAALRKTNAKFLRRWSYIEDQLAAQGRSLEEASLEEMEALWGQAKGVDRGDGEGEASR